MNFNNTNNTNNSVAVAVTAEMLTLPAYAGVDPREPVEGFVDFVNAVLRGTGTGLEDWSFTGQRDTRCVANGYFIAKWKRLSLDDRWRGFNIQFSMETGFFHVEASQVFELLQQQPRALSPR